MNVARRFCCLALVVSAALSADAAPRQRAKNGDARAAAKSATVKPAAAESAARALFLDSNIEQARASAAEALRADAADVRALFVEMEAAALAADTRAELDAALRLCETRRSDARTEVAATRVLELAANTEDFLPAIARIQKLLAAGSVHAPYLRAALLGAAKDGAPALDAASIARDAGMITHWRVNGPFGRHPNVDWEQSWRPEQDARLAAAYDQRKTEEFQFLDGNIVLPPYLRAKDGVFYAEATIEAPRSGEVTLRLETAGAGSAQLFLDGQSVLIKDDRLQPSADLRHVSLRLAAGPHRLLVKFLDNASPWRLTLLPAAVPGMRGRPVPALDAEQRYIRASLQYWQGDAAGVVATLAPSPNAPANSAANELLLGRALARLASVNDAPEPAAHFRAAVERSSGALAAAYELAAADFAAGRVEEAAESAERVASLRPGFVPAQELLSEAAERLGWDRIALRAFENRILLHPSCDTLVKAARLFAKSARYDRARAMEEGLKDCGPQTLAYSNALSDRGEHTLAAAEAARVVSRAPLDRDARLQLEKEARLAGNVADAAAAELARMAPNRLTATPAAADFYLPYRRDGLSLVRATASRRFSGGPIVIVLHDKAVRLNGDGSADEYLHRITRVLTREAITQYGEVAIPAGAELLELRTIKSDGRILEPELHEHKQTVSMPSLAPDDLIELEYTLHHAGHEALADYPEVFRYVFGSFVAPILYARFAVETPRRTGIHDDVRATEAANARLRTLQREDSFARIWEAEDIPQSLQEPAIAAEQLPTVAISPAYRGWSEVRDHRRELLIEAARAGAQVQAAAAQVQNDARAEESARRIIAYVQKNIASSDAEAFSAAELPSAEESLANGEGSRTVAALAIAHAAGLDARLLLARTAAAPAGTQISGVTFSRPLIEFVLHEKSGDRVVIADAETEGLAFGVLPPQVLSGAAAGDALEVTLNRPRGGEPLVALRPSAAREENFADADIRLDAGGNAEARLDIRMGSYRAAQMRAQLRGLRSAERDQFFEQIALRIFPGAVSVAATVRHESDAERPLSIELRCRVPQLIQLTRLAEEDALDIDQLVPPLGLKRMYAAAAERKFALAIEVPLFESATFRLHLPDAVTVAQRARDFRLENEFGSYTVEFRQPDARTLEVRRSFRIPAQVVEATAYPAFARFAGQIEEAERQRLSLARLKQTASGIAGAK
jgi:hypothetical protein